MPIKQKNLNDFGYYVDNLLFNHDIELLTQFVKDMSLKKGKILRFTEEDFKGKQIFL